MTHIYWKKYDFKVLWHDIPDGMEYESWQVSIEESWSFSCYMRQISTDIHIALLWKPLKHCRTLQLIWALHVHHMKKHSSQCRRDGRLHSHIIHLSYIQTSNMNVFGVDTKVNGLLSNRGKYQMKSEFYCNNLCLYLILS